MSMSGLVSELNVTIPCTSDGAMSASARAAATASTAKRSSERPESLENSVAPIPAFVGPGERMQHVRHPRLPAWPATGSSTVTVPVTWSPTVVGATEGDGDEAVPGCPSVSASLLGHRPCQRQDASGWLGGVPRWMPHGRGGCGDPTSR